MSDSLTPWTTAHQAPLSFTVSQGLLKLMSIELVMPSNHHIYCFNYKCAAAAAAKSLQSCLTLCDPIDDSLPGSAVPGILQASNTGVGCHFLLQGIFLTQESNPGLPHCRRTLYRLSHQGSLRIHVAAAIIIRRVRRENGEPFQTHWRIKLPLPWT